MRRLAGVLFGACLLAAVLMQSVGAGTGGTVDESIRSVALAGNLGVRVWLPSDYATSGRRYPVVYFLHGLPAGPDGFRGGAWLADALERAGGGAILVMPQGARSDDTDAEYLDHGPGRNWATFVARELPRAIDARFRTIRSRTARALIGVSAGGYGASILGLRNRSTFSVVESWSGYFHPTDPSGIQALPLGPETSVHTLVSELRADQRNMFFGFYCGTGDTRFRGENVELDAELKAAHVPHAFALYPGGHTATLWTAHAVSWVRLALTHLVRPAAVT